MTTFVSVGNARQPFARLLEAIKTVPGKLPGPVTVQHGHTPFAGAGFEAVAFMGMDEFAQRLARAELVIIHAGAGSIMHAIEAGKVPVVVPRRADRAEHVNDHQVALARALNDAGRVVCVDDVKDLAAAIDTALARQHQGQVRRDTTEGKMLATVRQALADYARR